MYLSIKRKNFYFFIILKIKIFTASLYLTHFHELIEVYIYNIHNWNLAYVIFIILLFYFILFFFLIYIFNIL